MKTNQNQISTTTINSSRNEENRKECICPKHGPFLSKRRQVGTIVFWSKCPICDQKRANRIQNNSLKLQAKGKVEYFRRIFGYWVPDRFRNASFNQFKTPSIDQFTVLQTAKSYVEYFEANHRKGLGLTFIGGTGTGKTMLASLILTTLYPAFVGVYVHLPRLLARMQQIRLQPINGVTEGTIEKVLTTCDLLVLDEIGATDRKTESKLLLRIVDARYSGKLPTIYISNLAKNDFEQFFDERVVSRITQVNTFVKFNWMDWRRQRAGKGSFSQALPPSE